MDENEEERVGERECVCVCMCVEREIENMVLLIYLNMIRFYT